MSNYEIKETLIECTKLPSGFGFYPKGTQVRFVPMRTREIEILNESGLSTLMIFEHTLSNIRTKVIKPEELTLNDFIFISLQRRLYSQTEIRCTLTSTCPKCGTKKVEDFDFNDIEFNEPKDNRVQSCELSGYKVEIAPLTIGGMIAMLKTERGVTAVDTLAHCIKTIYIPGSEIVKVPEEDKLKLATDIISNTWGEERDILNYIDDLHNHSIQSRKIKCKNESCGYTWDEDLGSPESLIFPSNRPKQSIADKVHPC